MSTDMMRRLGNMSISVPNNQQPKSEDQPKAMTKDERIEIVKEMIQEEQNGINLKNLYHKFIAKYPEKQNLSSYTYLTSFESFVHQQRHLLSCEIDDEGYVSPIAFSAEHFMEIFDKASSDERALNKELTGKFQFRFIIFKILILVGRLVEVLLEKNISWNNYGFATIYQLLQDYFIPVTIDVIQSDPDWNNYRLGSIILVLPN